MSNWETEPYEKRINDLKSMIVSYTNLVISNMPEKDLDTEVQIAYNKVDNLISNSENKDQMVNDIICFYGIEINFLLNTQNEDVNNENSNIN